MCGRGNGRAREEGERRDGGSFGLKTPWFTILMNKDAVVVCGLYDETKAKHFRIEHTGLLWWTVQRDDVDKLVSVLRYVIVEAGNAKCK